jgi:hypothetical protein
MATTLADIRRFDVVESWSACGCDVYGLLSPWGQACAF